MNKLLLVSIKGNNQQIKNTDVTNSTKQLVLHSNYLLFSGENFTVAESVVNG